MKKIIKLIALPLCALALVGCSGEKELSHVEALDYSKKNFSAESVLAKYESVTYDRKITVEYEDALEDKKHPEVTEKNEAVLAKLKTAFVGLDSKQETVVLNDTTLDEFFFGEKFLDEFEKEYSAPSISPTYEKIKTGGLRCNTTYSKPFNNDQLTALDVKEGGIAVKSTVVSNNEGCIISTTGNSAVAINVDGDDKNTADVQYTITIDVTFTWNVKAA